MRGSRTSRGIDRCCRRAYAPPRRFVEQYRGSLSPSPSSLPPFSPSPWPSYSSQESCTFTPWIPSNSRRILSSKNVERQGAPGDRLYADSARIAEKREQLNSQYRQVSRHGQSAFPRARPPFRSAFLSVRLSVRLSGSSSCFETRFVT
jgi:hypothetical protein